MKAFRVLLSGILLLSISSVCLGSEYFKRNIIYIPYSKYIRSFTILTTQEPNRFNDEKDRPDPINRNTVKELAKNNIFFRYEKSKGAKWEMGIKRGNEREINLQVIEREYDLLDDKIKVIMKFPYFIQPPGKVYMQILNARTELSVFINNKPIFSSKYFGLPDESSRLLIPESGMWFRPDRVEIKTDYDYDNSTKVYTVSVCGMYKTKNYDNPGGRPKDLGKVWDLPEKYNCLSVDLKYNPSVVIDDDWMNREALKKEKEYKKIQCD